MTERYDALATRDGFNNALRHFQQVNEYVQSVASGYNLADVLSDNVKNGSVKQSQIIPIVNAVLYEKFQYANVGFNFGTHVSSAKKIHSILEKWNALVMVLMYYDPVVGVVPINPANASSLENGLPFVKNEYASLYVGAPSFRAQKLIATAATDVMRVLNGKSVTQRKQYLHGVQKVYRGVGSREKVKVDEPRGAVPSQRPQRPTPAQSAIPSDGSYRVTPKYSVLVTNELFHNGNVEAWKKIIESYVNVFSGNEILIWYENERIKDINTLFKWGKVKNGTPIIFSVAGTQIAAVSKLQRYLFEGASPRFESFLQSAHNQVLDLF